MAINPNYTTEHLHTIVPACTPAWLRICNRLESTETGPAVWSDVVWPVVAYATLGTGNGAYLACCPFAGPIWIEAEMESEIDLQLYVGKEPSPDDRAKPPIGWGEYTHSPESFPDGIEASSYVFPPGIE